MITIQCPKHRLQKAVNLVKNKKIKGVICIKCKKKKLSTV